MGCAFSRNRVRVRARVPRIFKRRKVSRSRNYLSSTPRGVSTLTTSVGITNSHSVQSERPATPKNNRQTEEYYTADVAPSTLLWLVGPKDCVEISIPELVVMETVRTRALHTFKHLPMLTTTGIRMKKTRNKGNESILPTCLEYQGYHEYGFHVFTVSSSVLNSTVQDMSVDCVPDAIASIVCVDNEPFVLVYKNNSNQTTYLPNPPACGKDLLHRICTRFGDKVLRVVLYQPSWYLRIVLDEQDENGCYFSSAVTQKLRVTSDFKELARLTGFPGEIKRKSPGTRVPIGDD